MILPINSVLMSLYSFQLTYNYASPVFPGSTWSYWHMEVRWNVLQHQHMINTVDSSVLLVCVIPLLLMSKPIRNVATSKQYSVLITTINFFYNSLNTDVLCRKVQCVLQEYNIASDVYYRWHHNRSDICLSLHHHRQTSVCTSNTLIEHLTLAVKSETNI